MTTPATTLLNPDTPALTRIRALLALLAGLIFKPNAKAQIEQLFAAAEAQLARYLLDLALKQTGNPYLTADMYDARIIWRGAMFDVDIQLRSDAVHPFTHIIVRRRIAGIYARACRTRAHRSNISSRITVIVGKALRRHAKRVRARHCAHLPFTLDTPSRVVPPP